MRREKFIDFFNVWAVSLLDVAMLFQIVRNIARVVGRHVINQRRVALFFQSSCFAKTEEKTIEAAFAELRHHFG